MRNVRPVGVGAVLAIAATLAMKAFDSGYRDLSFIVVIALGGAAMLYFLTPYRFEKPDSDTRKSWDPSQMEDDQDGSPPPGQG